MITFLTLPFSLSSPPPPSQKEKNRLHSKMPWHWCGLRSACEVMPVLRSPLPPALGRAVAQTKRMLCSAKRSPSPERTATSENNRISNKMTHNQPKHQSWKLERTWRSARKWSLYITSRYLKFNVHHFGVPPISNHRTKMMTRLGSNFEWTDRTYAPALLFRHFESCHKNTLLNYLWHTLIFLSRYFPSPCGVWPASTPYLEGCQRLSLQSLPATVVKAAETPCLGK